jgi:hypothetical protein
VKLNCQLGKAHVKIEINTITRGVLEPTGLATVSQAVQSEFEKFAAINVVSFGDLYGGKICAALDRQHPRDLFDVSVLLNREGLTEHVRLGMIMVLLSHPRPVAELLNPHLKDQHHAFDNQFHGMPQKPFSYKEYEETRAKLIKEVRNVLSSKDRVLLTSFEAAEPKWELYPYPDLKKLPAVQWKLVNIRKLAEQQPKKHVASQDALDKILS